VPDYDKHATMVKASCIDRVSGEENSPPIS
jgi:hypothetical protein